MRFAGRSPKASPGPHSIPLLAHARAGGEAALVVVMAATVPDLQHVTRLKFVESLACLRLTLWDEEGGKLVGFRDLRRAPAREARAA